MNTEFNYLRFKSSFSFKNAKAENMYFENLLMKSLYQYQEKQKTYFDEKLHITFSYSVVLKIAAYFILGFSIVSPMFNMAIAFTAVAVFLTSLFLNRKFKTDYAIYSCILAFNEDEEFIASMKKIITENQK